MRAVEQCTELFPSAGICFLRNNPICRPLTGSTIQRVYEIVKLVGRRNVVIGMNHEGESFQILFNCPCKRQTSPTDKDPRSRVVSTVLESAYCLAMVVLAALIVARTQPDDRLNEL